MLHYVLKDVNPDKVSNFDHFLKEINAIMFMLTLGKAPAVNGKLLTEQGEQTFNVVDGDYRVVFQGEKLNQKVINANFNLFQGKISILEIAYSIAENRPIDMRIKLNAPGEKLAQSELERAFKRDFSFKSIAFMQSDSNSTESIQENSPSDEGEKQTETLESAQFLDHEIHTAKEIKNEINPEIEEEINVLSSKVMHAIVEVNEMILLLHNLSYDFTRGSSPDLTTLELNEETLENGALVQLIDAEENNYRVTFRKGSLDNMSEVSFFLEKDANLIFSVYFSSQGNGKIVAGGEQAELTLKKLKNELE